MIMNNERYQELMLRFAKELHDVGVTESMKEIVEAQYTNRPNLSNPHTEDLSKKYADFLALMKKSLEWEMLNNSNNNDSTILDRENLRFQHWSSRDDES